MSPITIEEFCAGHGPTTGLLRRWPSCSSSAVPPCSGRARRRLWRLCRGFSHSGMQPLHVLASATQHAAHDLDEPLHATDLALPLVAAPVLGALPTIWYLTV